MTVKSFPGYGAIPGAHGQILTTNGANGTNWMQQGVSLNAAQSSSFEIRNDRHTIVFNTDGTITTKAGTITSEDWITVIQLMKRLIIDMSKDQELASKYPYIQEAAHTWFMDELKGKDNGKE